MILLREIKEEDALLMLEWMHDKDIQKGFKKDMLSKTLVEVKSFCASVSHPSEIKNGDSLHFAIVDENDEYLGTISLKDIDLDNRVAEYAIVTRKKAHGKGVAFKATGEILKYAFEELKLHRVFLSVYANNIPAIKLYEKSGFHFEGEFREHLMVDGKFVNWKWYGILESEYDGDLFK